MTFNVRHAARVGADEWEERRPVVCDVIQRQRPDIVGTQEGLFHQLTYMERHLDAFRWIGLGREGGSRGEFLAIFYRKDRLEPIAFDHYWLSDTPRVIGSTSFGNRTERMVTWARFLDLETDRQIVAVNTHLDHRVQESREKSADLIIQRMPKVRASVPAVVLGDFNAVAEKNPVWTRFQEAGFTDAWLQSQTDDDRRPSATYHGFRGPSAARRRIDWILHRGPLRTRKAWVVTDHHGGQYPSDHFPVMADLAYA